MTYLPNSDDRNLSTSKVLEELKTENNDFEWYPTTPEIINAIAEDILKADCVFKLDSIFDIGCGDGRVLKGLQRIIKDKRDNYISDLYGIEKARNLIARWDEDITFVGGDFYNTNIAVIKSDVIFSNPPYSDFEQWATSIINNSYSTVIYLVLPSRWAKSERIKSALKKRDLFASVIYKADFFNAERKARAEVDVIRVVSNIYSYNSSNSRMKSFITKEIGDKPYSFTGFRNSDPFNVWFNESFPDFEKKVKNEPVEEEKAKNELFKKTNQIDDLVKLYQKDLTQVVKSFKLLNMLDTSVFKALSIDIETIKRTIKERIKQIKAEYWSHFIDNYEPITKRLTKKYRDKVYNNLTSKTKNIEFTRLNALIITEMVIKKADLYAEEQIKDFFFDLSSKDAIINYKSNKKIFDGGNGWRFMKPNIDTHSHYHLDYRIVQPRLFNIETHFNGSINGYSVKQVISDICVISRLVGMPVPDYINGEEYINKDITYGERNSINYFDINKNEVSELFVIKFFKNGNQHLFLNKEFALRLNLMMGKLCGWVYSAEDAYNEMGGTGESKEEFNKVYKTTKTKSLTLGVDPSYFLSA